MEQKLSNEDLAQLEQALIQRRDTLRGELKDEKKTFVPTESASQDIELSYVAGLDREVEAELDYHRDTELHDVEFALERIKNGRYGTCHECGEHINKDRLKAFPTARRCIKCKQLFEQKSELI